MKSILFTKKDTAEFVDEAMPEPWPGQVRIRLVRSCISSGTERAKLVGVPDSGVGACRRDAQSSRMRRSVFTACERRGVPRRAV